LVALIAAYTQEIAMTLTEARPAPQAPSSPDPTAPQEPSTLVPRIVTGILVLGPLVALGLGLPLLWGHVVHLRDVILGLILYAITGHGVTVGFHRMFTHRSFKPKRALKIVLGVAGSLAVEGSLVSWVANHRRHHRFSDSDGDPHSPHGSGPGIAGQIRGFAHAHVGWLFKADTTSASRFAPDLLKDRDVTVISRLFPLFAVVSLAIPFASGWLLSRTLAGALSALLWAGLVRMALLHHVTWSINSVCHMFGRRPFTEKDRSTNVAALAIVSLGESWHNFHHAFPSSARHGVGRGQLDSSAALIRFFERAGWATKVRWPREHLAATATT
jgi:stearoyl-CoA desaturase (delta-9 desaturase)